MKISLRNLTVYPAPVAAPSIGFGKLTPKAMTQENDNVRLSENTPEPGHRISIRAARKMLGMVGRNYSDDDIAEILNILYGIAEEGYEAYLEENGDAQDMSEQKYRRRF